MVIETAPRSTSLQYDITRQQIERMNQLFLMMSTCPATLGQPRACRCAEVRGDADSADPKGPGDHLQEAGIGSVELPGQPGASRGICPKAVPACLSDRFADADGFKLALVVATLARFARQFVALFDCKTERWLLVFISAVIVAATPRSTECQRRRLRGVIESGVPAFALASASLVRSTGCDQELVA